MTYEIYALYASLQGEAAPWMVAAEDEYSWEGDPDRCEREFQEWRDKAKENDWDVREITLTVDMNKIIKAFEVPHIEVEVKEVKDDDND